MPYEILTTTQMAEADRATIAGGVEGFTLMSNAGAAVAEFILEVYPEAQRIVVLCGPGNNGGDGFVVAELLRKAKREVVCACLMNGESLKGDALKAYNQWWGETVRFEDIEVGEADLVVDAVFGTGFKGVLKTPVADVFDRVECPVVAVDIASGVNGDTGEVDEHALQADFTITFHRKKLGHVLMPGAAFCGDVRVADIGITADFEHEALENVPALWLAAWPDKMPYAHKYDSGAAQIYGAPKLTGATRLAAEACARIGAGLVSVIAPKGRAMFTGPACLRIFWFMIKANRQSACRRGFTGRVV
ncbi:MAG: NAD(P)H-hydrate epimerase [Rhodospirillales bacterium]|nr:NAD(P)H-hydrate epimerase [Rhodospirillales bacterium]